MTQLVTDQCEKHKNFASSMLSSKAGEAVMVPGVHCAQWRRKICLVARLPPRIPNDLLCAVPRRVVEEVCW